jgi:hypothetical protein
MQQPHLEDNTQAWVWKAVPIPKIQTKNGSDHASSGPLFYFCFFFRPSCCSPLDTAVNRWAARKERQPPSGPRQSFVCPRIVAISLSMAATPVRSRNSMPNEGILVNNSASGLSDK